MLMSINTTGQFMFTCMPMRNRLSMRSRKLMGIILMRPLELECFMDWRGALILLVYWSSWLFLPCSRRLAIWWLCRWDSYFDGLFFVDHRIAWRALCDWQHPSV